MKKSSAAGHAEVQKASPLELYNLAGCILLKVSAVEKDGIQAYGKSQWENHNVWHRDSGTKPCHLQYRIILHLRISCWNDTWPCYGKLIIGEPSDHMSGTTHNELSSLRLTMS